MTAPTPRPTTEGSFARTPFANVLLYAREKKMTGTFVVRIPAPAEGADDDGAGTSTLVMEQGSLVAARLERFGQSLGWVLHGLGFIDDDLFVRVEQALAAPGAEEIPTVLRMRAADPKSLDVALREQFRRKVVALFGWSEGTYAYFAGTDLLDGADRARSTEDVLPIVWRGMQKTPPSEQAMATVFGKIAGRGLRLREGHEFDRFEFGDELGLAATQLRSAASSPEQLKGLARKPELVPVMLYLLALTKQIEAVSLGSVSSGALPSVGGAAAPKPAGPPSVPPATAAQAPVKSVPPPATPDAATISTSLTPMDGSLVPNTKLAEARVHAQRMEHWTYFEMFDLPRSASLEDVRAKFPTIAAQWHPDRAATMELRALHNEIFSLYNHAFATLTDQKSRDQYEETLAGGGGTPAAQKKVAAVLDTVHEGHRAEIALKRKDYVEAERMLRSVLESNPDDIALNVLLCQCLLETNPAPHLEDIIVRLAKVIRTTDGNDRAYYLMGMALKFKGDRRAMSFFKTALDINPGNLDAQREWRIFEMRRDARNSERNSIEGKLKGFVTGLFGAPEKPKGK